jgi:hypothetical protein
MYPPMPLSWSVQAPLNRAGFYEPEAPGEITKPHKGNEIQPQFTVRGKTFSSQEAAAEWLADQERMEAAKEFLQMIPSEEGPFSTARLLAIRELGAMIQGSPKEVAQALEIRCSPQALSTFVDELMLLRDGGF